MSKIYKILVIVICLPALGALAALKVAAGQWGEEKDMITGRQEIYADAADGVVYVPSGISRDGESTVRSFEAFISKDGAWRELARLPEARHHITPAIIGQKLYAMGGFIGPHPNWAIKSDMFIYDIGIESWSFGASLPVPLGEHVAVDNKVHVIGGWVRGEDGKDNFNSYEDSKKYYIYDSEVGEWLEGSEAPTARISAAAAVIDGLIYVVGGRENLRQEDGKSLQHNMGTLEVYNPKTDTWRTRIPMP